MSDIQVKQNVDELLHVLHGLSHVIHFPVVAPVGSCKKVPSGQVVHPSSEKETPQVLQDEWQIILHFGRVGSFW